MKKILLYIFLCLTTTFFSQVSDIANLASGKLEMFTTVYDLDNSVFGYLTIYKLDYVSKTEKKYEYVLLDKNLNKVSNGQFIDPVYKRFNSDFFYPEKMGNEIIISKAYNFIGAAVQTSFSQSTAKFGFTSHRILNLKNNEISESFYYQDKKLIAGHRDIKKIKSIAKKQKAFDYPVTFSDGFFLVENVKDNLKYYKDLTKLNAYDANRKLKWSYEYNAKNEHIVYSFMILDEENVLVKFYNYKTESVSFHSLNPKTGELIFKYELENKKSDYYHTFQIKALDDKFVVLGKYCKQGRFGGYDQEKAKGYYKIELDKKGKEISKKYLPWTELTSVIDIKENGKLEEENYRLSTKRFFAYKNGKVSIINEKRKENTRLSGVVTVKTTDFVILNFDKDFNVVSKEVIEKDKSKSFWSQTDYLFSQKINDENGSAFFYVDSKKEEGKRFAKKRILGIVVVKDGKVSNEQIPVENIQHIYKAKEGYVLFREFNKKEGINEIRLERLNL